MTKIIFEQFSLPSLFYGFAAWALAFLSGSIYMKLMGITDKEVALADNLLHTIAFVVLIAATVIFYLRLRGMDTGGQDFGLFTAHSFFLVNIVMDLIILIGFMKFDFVKWALVGIPAYGIIFYGLYFLLKK